MSKSFAEFMTQSLTTAAAKQQQEATATQYAKQVAQAIFDEVSMYMLDHAPAVKVIRYSKELSLQGIRANGSSASVRIVVTDAYPDSAAVSIIADTGPQRLHGGATLGTLAPVLRDIATAIVDVQFRDGPKVQVPDNG